MVPALRSPTENSVTRRRPGGNDNPPGSVKRRQLEADSNDEDRAAAEVTVISGVEQEIRVAIAENAVMRRGPGGNDNPPGPVKRRRLEAEAIVISDDEDRAAAENPVTRRGPSGNGNLPGCRCCCKRS